MARSDKLRIALAQLNLLVGDVRGNLERAIAEARRAHEALRADLVLLPELTLSGYPPEDLLFHRGLRLQIERALSELKQAVPEIGVMVGYPEYADGRIYNSALLLRGGRVLAHHRKAVLPNYKVFDEKRYFTPGSEATVVDFDGWRLGLLICEDVWEPPPAQWAKGLGAEALLIINASPYEIHKQREREQVLGDRIREVHLPAVYVNLLGGQDEKAPSDGMDRHYRGSINHRFHLEMSFNLVQGKVAGIYRYVRFKDQAPLKISGALGAQGEFLADEFDDHGNKTGTFEGHLGDHGAIRGIWSKPDGSKTMDFELLPW